MVSSRSYEVSKKERSFVIEDILVRYLGTHKRVCEMSVTTSYIHPRLWRPLTFVLFFVGRSVSFVFSACSRDLAASSGCFDQSGFATLGPPCSFIASFRQVAATGEPGPGGPDSSRMLRPARLAAMQACFDALLPSCNEHPCPGFRGVLNEGGHAGARGPTGEGSCRDH